MNGKWTPGPWEAEVHELSSGPSGIVYDRNGYRIGTDHLTPADARLISAAPDLVEALRAMIADFGDYPASERPCRAFDLARAALQKAGAQ